MQILPSRLSHTVSHWWQGGDPGVSQAGMVPTGGAGRTNMFQAKIPLCVMAVSGDWWLHTFLLITSGTRARREEPGGSIVHSPECTALALAENCKQSQLEQILLAFSLRKKTFPFFPTAARRQEVIERTHWTIVA